MRSYDQIFRITLHLQIEITGVNHKITSLLVLCLATLSLFTASCVQGRSSPLATSISPDRHSEDTISVSGSRVLETSYYEIGQKSDIIIIGQVQSEVGVINGARDYPNTSSPDPHIFSVAPVYQVKVERYIKGDGPKNIYIARAEGAIHHGKTPSSEEITQARLSGRNELYAPLSFNKDYLMFLSERDVYEDYDIEGMEQGGLFSLAGSQWLFDATDPERVTVVDVSRDIPLFFPPQKLEEILLQVNNPDMSPPALINPPYPLPMEDSSPNPMSTTLPYPTP